jgi:putative restriction endonuclease
VNGFVGVTDPSWYRYLLGRPDLEEANFWMPGGGTFASLRPGEPFFFKLKAPLNAIGGFGLFARYEQLPLWQAWSVFGPANGAPTEETFRRTITGAAHSVAPLAAHRVVGCAAVVQPIFFAPDEWVDVPADFQRQIVRGKGYSLERGPGAQLWAACLERAAARRIDWVLQAEDARRIGKPQLIEPRLGQGSFRLAVLAAYGGACAVTTEHSAPVLDAAHIRPWSIGGLHEVANGLALRSDLHRLFDLGYLAVGPDDLKLAVSPRLRDEYANGRTYYALEGREIIVPESPSLRPSHELLGWHREEVFRR